MKKKTDESTRSAADVRADDPKQSMDRLAVLTRKVLRVPKKKSNESA